MKTNKILSTEWKNKHYKNSEQSKKFKAKNTSALLSIGVKSKLVSKLKI